MVHSPVAAPAGHSILTGASPLPEEGPRSGQTTPTLDDLAKSPSVKIC